MRCEDKLMPFPMAVKFSQAEKPEQLKREAHIMQRVAHAHVCRLLHYSPLLECGCVSV